MSAYEYGKSATQGASSAAVQTREQVRADTEAIQQQTRRDLMMLKSLETRLETCRQDQAKVSERLASERAKVNETRALVRDAERQAKESLGSAQREAILVLATAERECASIRETAYQQARVLQDGAHSAGFKRGRDQAIARNAALRKVRGVAA